MQQHTNSVCLCQCTCEIPVQSDTRDFLPYHKLFCCSYDSFMFFHFWFNVYACVHVRLSVTFTTNGGNAAVFVLLYAVAHVHLQYHWGSFFVCLVFFVCLFFFNFPTKNTMHCRKDNAKVAYRRLELKWTSL